MTSALLSVAGEEEEFFTQRRSRFINLHESSKRDGAIADLLSNLSEKKRHVLKCSIPKAMFLHLSVIVFTGGRGVSVPACATGHMTSEVSVQGVSVRETPWTETSQTETPWTESLLDRDPLDRDPLERDPPGQEAPRQRPPGQSPPQTEIPPGKRPLDRDPAGQIPPLDRDPPWMETPRTETPVQ